MKLITIDALGKELQELRQLADEQNTHYKKAHDLLYSALARTYLWWRKANGTKGMLENIYKDHGIQYKKIIKAEENFSPLLRYLWAMDGTENSNTIDQWNRALNKVHVEYEGNKQFYKQNTESRIISYFKTSGGISKLAAYSSAFAEGEAEVKKKKKIDINLEQKRLAAHVDKGRSSFSKSSNYLATFQAQRTLSTGNGDIGVALFKRTKNGYAILNVVDDKTVVDDIIVRAYRRDTQDVPYTLRFIAEVINTQLVPFEMRRVARRLNESSKDKDDNGKVMMRLRRLLYMAKEKVFLLSATRGASSVVTVSYPLQPIVSMKENGYLVINDRNFIEDEILYAGDINFYTTDHPRHLEVTKGEAASHKLFLEHSITHKSRYIRFNPTSSYTSDASKVQSLLKRGIRIKPNFNIKVNSDWLNELDAKFLSRWINGFGQAVKRKEYAVLRLGFGKTSMSFQFIQRGDSYDDTETVAYKSPVQARPITVEVLSKDIVPVLNFLVDAECEGDVSISVDSKVIIFRIKTKVAEHIIYVPTCTHKGKRNEDYFEGYKA